MLELKHLETSYGQSQVLFGVDLQVNEGEVVTLLGRNGMGKTTTINSIMGMVRARSGEINFEGNQIREWPAHRVAQSGMGLVPEGRQIFPNLNVIENLVATSANRFKTRILGHWIVSSICFRVCWNVLKTWETSFQVENSKCWPSAEL